MSVHLKQNFDGNKAMQQPAPQFNKNYSPNQSEDEVAMVSPGMSSDKDFRDRPGTGLSSSGQEVKDPQGVLQNTDQISGATSQILNPGVDEESLEDALIDLYLSVKIRSNEEIDNYNEDKLIRERQKLQ